MDRTNLGSIKEGFICPGIWAILSALYVSGFRLWDEHAHRGKSIISAQDWAELMGAIVGQFVLMAICLSAVALYRRRKNVTSFILLDWRWWLAFVILSLLLRTPLLAWLWVGLIYQTRLSMKPKVPRLPK